MRTCITLLVLAAAVLAGCPKTQSVGSASPPQQPPQASQPLPASQQPVSKQPSVPSSVSRDLPGWDDSFTVLEYNGQRSAPRVKARSPWDADATAKWMIAKLAEAGYESGDNPSRILEGVEYTNPQGEYEALYIKVSLERGGRCTVEYQAR
ncbi:hypothetical protein IIA79_01880 [bacterium]|nr:hypothetical protein [bacterium]